MRATTQAKRDDGYIMVALLVSMAVAAVWITVLLPAWRQQALRQKEDDLVFRGEQYARAIALYYNKNGAYPPSVDVLVTQKFLRRKWKDPITGKDFLLVPAPSPTGQQAAQPVGGAGRTGGAAPTGIAQGSQLTTGFLGVRSESPATSIKIYLQQQVYNQWPFDMSNACQRGVACNMNQGQGNPNRGGGPGRGGDGRSGTAGPGGRPVEGGGGPARGVTPPPGGGRGPGGATPVGPGRGRG
jgi:type II secretory pathway pseudopilin PulG